jgi:hypothetical protein
VFARVFHASGPFNPWVRPFGSLDYTDFSVGASGSGALLVCFLASGSVMCHLGSVLGFSPICLIFGSPVLAFTTHPKLVELVRNK